MSTAETIDDPPPLNDNPIPADPTSETKIRAPEASAAVEVSLGEAAFQRIAHLAALVEERDLSRINVDIQAVVMIAVGALPRIKSMRPEAVRQLPLHDLTLLDAFEDIVVALGAADSEMRASPKGRRVAKDAAKALRVKRTQLHDVAWGLYRCGLLDQQPPKSLGKLPGYRRLVSDIGLLVQLLRRNWDNLIGKVPVTLHDLVQIDREVLAFTQALSLDGRSVKPRDLVIRRRQLYALFRRAVADLRRIANYLYGDDAGSVIPVFANVAKTPSRKRAVNPNDGGVPTSSSESKTSRAHPCRTTASRAAR